MIQPNKYVKNLIPYVPGKPVEELEREIGIQDAIKIASNENSLGPSPLAIDAVAKALGKVNRYPDGDAFYLKNKLAERLRIKPANLIFGNGSKKRKKYFSKLLKKKTILKKIFLINFPHNLMSLKKEFII